MLFNCARNVFSCMVSVLRTQRTHEFEEVRWTFAIQTPYGLLYLERLTNHSADRPVYVGQQNLAADSHQSAKISLK